MYVGVYIQLISKIITVEYNESMDVLRLKHVYLKAQSLYIMAAKEQMLTKFQNMLIDKGKTKLLYDNNSSRYDTHDKSASRHQDDKETKTIYKKLMLIYLILTKMVIVIVVTI
jgi:hypothetical protein